MSGGQPLCPDCGGELRSDPWNYDLIWAVLCLVLAPLLLVAISIPLAQDFALSQWPQVEAEVLASVLEEHGHSRLARVELRYRFEGREYSRPLLREPNAQPVRSKKDIKRERDFLAEYPQGSRRAVFVDPSEPSVLRSEVGGYSVFVMIFLAFVVGGVSACDDLGELFWARSIHAGCKLKPQASGPGLDHRRALSDPQWFGPRSTGTFLLLGGVAAVALVAGRANWPWLIVLALSAFALLVFTARTIGELRFYARWRKTELRMENPHTFVPGVPREARLSGAPARVEYSIQLRREEEHCPDDDEDTEEPWGWASEVVRNVEPLEVEQVEGGEILIRWCLPVDAELPWREEGTRRQRWVLSARQGARDVLFELDFSPAEFPGDEVLAASSLLAPSLWETRALAATGLASSGPLPRPSWYSSATRDLNFRDQEILRAQGGVVWGRVVQANRQCRDEGDDVPGVVCFAANDAVTPDDLALVARCLYATKAAPVDRLSQIMADEHTQFFSYPAPNWLSGGREVYVHTMVFLKDLMPGGRLSSNLVPVVVAPRHTRAAMVLPQSLWSDELRAWWLDQA